jgi:Uma2 family endonuclease
MAFGASVRPISVDEYHRMAEAGILDAEERVELLEGLLVKMPPLGGAHIACHTHLVKYLILQLGDAAQVAGMASLALQPRSEPQPDITIFAPREGMLASKSWTSEDILAVIEIADSSIARDSVAKQRIYARGAIGEYLIVDLKRRALMRFTEPAADGYGHFETLRAGETFVLRTLPHVTLDVARFFG